MTMIPVLLDVNIVIKCDDDDYYYYCGDEEHASHIWRMVINRILMYVSMLLMKC